MGFRRCVAGVEHLLQAISVRVRAENQMRGRYGQAFFDMCERRGVS